MDDTERQDKTVHNAIHRDITHTHTQEHMGRGVDYKIGSACNAIDARLINGIKCSVYGGYEAGNMFQNREAKGKGSFSTHREGEGRWWLFILETMATRLLLSMMAATSTSTSIRGSGRSLARRARAQLSDSAR